MAQLVTVESFTLADLQTEAGVQKLNTAMLNMAKQIQLMQGTLGTIKPDADIDLQGKYKIVNEAT